MLSAYRFVADDPLQTEAAELEVWLLPSSLSDSPAVDAAAGYGTGKAIDQLPAGGAINNGIGAYGVAQDLNDGQLGSYAVDATALAAGSATGVTEAAAVIKGTQLDVWLDLEAQNLITYIQGATANRRVTAPNN